ncbi:MAG: hypothetical protein ACLRT4_09085 [Thomasclavelia sp.]
MAVNIFDFIDTSKRLRKKNIYFQYSTSEQFTGEYWTDGSKIYCKTISVGALNSTTKQVAHGISNLKRVIKFEGYATNNGVYVSIPRGHLDNEYDAIGVEANSSMLTVRAGMNNVFTSCHITIYYNKN